MIEKGGIKIQKGLFEMIGNLAGMHQISIGCGLVAAFKVIIYERKKRL